MSKTVKLPKQSELSAFPSTDETPFAPVYADEPLHHGPSAAAFESLRAIDWGFTEEDTRFLGHDLHPYPAKFIPQLPGTFISRLSSRGELVCDPFGGSGTTALEAIRLGRRAISSDANPVATLIGRVKTARVSGNDTSELHGLHTALRALLEGKLQPAKQLIEQYGELAPVIANREKWFADEALGELAHIKARIAAMSGETARSIASLALSRTVLAASFQDSETRYKSVTRVVEPGEVTRRYVREFEAVMRSVARNASATRYGISKFASADVRFFDQLGIEEESVDLVVTSPPYGNATDYHLYHRFRLLWLGYDPIALGKVEIGSHLKHQREASSFDSYFRDLIQATATIARVLKPGRYAAMVIGDSIYSGITYQTAELLAAQSESLGFSASVVIEREVHRTKRSFTPAGRRTLSESLLVMQKRPKRTLVFFDTPPYRPWPYEGVLREREIERIAGRPAKADEDGLRTTLDPASLYRAKSLVFTHQLTLPGGRRESTWQAILENGMATVASARKDPKYVTHGIHSYKGKFYPQLAKGLINQLGLSHGAAILDPFCGSGTTLLEGYLNGYRSHGCDLHPLAAHIAHAKTAVLEVEPDVLTEAVSNLVDAVERAPVTCPASLSQFKAESHDEVLRWFATPIAHKVNWLLTQIRAVSDGAVRAFLEVVLSSIIRDVSQQEPSDLRIRYRKEPLEDADVFGMFQHQLQAQFSRVEKFWRIRGHAPNPFFQATAVAGDNRSAHTYGQMGLVDGSVDLVLTSPPYAMALPYIDTDRLSLLTLFGLTSSDRRPLEHNLIGSRELNAGTRSGLETEFSSAETLPVEAMAFVRKLRGRVDASKHAGFRKQNMPALVYRFLRDMDAVIQQMHRLMKPDAEAMVVIGDSRMCIDDKDVRIPSTDLVETIAQARGFSSVERIDISVTTENLVHIKNAITKNVVLRFRKPR
jgi:DNA modification methylase